jgi:DNA-3-methyladenine glycosylase II
MNTSITFSLKPVPPFRLGLTAWALRRRPNNLIDRWDGETYRRVLVVNGYPAEVAVRQSEPPDSPRIQVSLAARRISPQMKASVSAALERLLGSRINLTEFYRLAEADPRLGVLAQRFLGLKPPRFPTIFEALANAIACQQMSLSLGILLLSRITERFGVAVEGTGGAAHAFPRPEDLADLQPTTLRKLGFSYQKAQSLIDLARACVEGRANFDGLTDLNNETSVKRLVEFRGIGRWSAEYVLLRGLGRLNVYPGDDVGARNSLRSWLKLRKPLDYDGVHRLTAKWQPYAGFVYFHMLLNGLDAAGYLASKSLANKLGVSNDAGRTNGRIRGAGII